MIGLVTWPYRPRRQRLLPRLRPCYGQGPQAPTPPFWHLLIDCCSYYCCQVGPEVDPEGRGAASKPLWVVYFSFAAVAAADIVS